MEKAGSKTGAHRVATEFRRGFGKIMKISSAGTRKAVY
jgi:hypothetical protein